jgi:hypothetical protein
MLQKELAEKEEEQRDYGFNHLRPMTKVKQRWQEKWLDKEENGSSSGEGRLKLPRIRVAATQNRIMATQDRATATQDQVTATRARRKIDKRSN